MAAVAAAFRLFGTNLNTHRVSWLVYLNQIELTRRLSTIACFNNKTVVGVPVAIFDFLLPFCLANRLPKVAALTQILQCSLVGGGGEQAKKENPA